MQELVKKTNFREEAPGGNTCKKHHERTLTVVASQAHCGHTFILTEGKQGRYPSPAPWVVPSAVVGLLVTSAGPLVADSDICWLSVAKEVPDAVLNMKSWYFQSQKTILLQTTVSVALSAVMTENELLILH